MINIPQSRATAALQTAFIADTLAMPVHWYYNPADIFKAFPGGIKQFEDAPDFHPSSIMSLHSTRQGGRATTSQHQKQVVGDVILKGRQHFWGQANLHYHHGMKAGDNTLNAHCARLVLRCLAKGYSRETFLDDYIRFMCADPPPHPDTYAESYHRGFFANYIQGTPPMKCAAITHDTASVGGLVTVAPLIITCAFQGQPLSSVQKLARAHLALTHPDDELARVCNYYAELLVRLMTCEPDTATDILEDIARRSVSLSLSALVKKNKSDMEVVGRQFSPACYISDAWPSVLYFAYRYHHSAHQALIANTNVGGDNVHRGFILGTIMGLIAGSASDSLFGQLSDNDALQQEISNAFSQIKAPVL
ncbi:ADP-ribosylglycohydrolase family protein [Salinimonas lutimaris]|uniref:ADP-ribosylglycohydrolase family protein n=1 Tax=Salinimonas lutimaris TaxID=914153 RepID=UPI0010BFD41C|nr:ADP-ribosylglycohydrolase family protein [Salinimonas lutimaris]